MKKIKISLILFSAIAMFASGILLTGCQKEDELTLKSTENQPSEESFQNLTLADLPAIEVKDGVLHFANDKDLSKFNAIVRNISSENRIEWEKSINFISLQTVFDNIVDAERIHNAPFEDMSEEEIKKIEELPALHSDLYYTYLNKGIIKEFDKDTDDEYYDLSIYNPSLAYIANIEGFFAVGETIYQITEKFEKIITDGDFSKIEKLKQTNTTNEEENILVISFENTGKGTTALNRTSPWVASGGGKKGEKRINIRLYFHSYLYNTSIDQFRVYHNVYVKCQERNWRRQWVYKSTEIWLNGSWEFYTWRPYNKSYYLHQTGVSNFSGSISPFTGSPSPWETSWLYNGRHAYDYPKLNQASWSVERYGGPSGLTATVSY